MNNNKEEKELDEIEERLIREEEESKKAPMPVSGRSVFEIKRIKDKSSKN